MTRYPKLFELFFMVRFLRALSALWTARRDTFSENQLFDSCAICFEVLECVMTNDHEVVYLFFFILFFSEKSFLFFLFISFPFYRGTILLLRFWIFSFFYFSSSSRRRPSIYS